MNHPESEWMRAAIAQARECLSTGDVPVGAIVVDASGKIIGRGRNLRVATGDPLAHAEVVALRDAATARGSWRLDDATLVVTLEPCVMCAGAILASRIGRLVFGAWDDKAGASGSVYDVVRDRRLPHRVDVTTGVLADECAALLTGFFRETLPD